MTGSLLERLERLKYETSTESDDRLVGEAISEIERLQSELDSAKRMIARLRGSSIEAEETLSAWQPIGTAPKDGTLILIREESGRVQVARRSCPDGYHSDWYVQLTGSIGDGYPTWNVIEWAPIPE